MSELSFKFKDKAKETELGTLFKNLSFEPITKIHVNNANDLREQLLNVFPAHKQEVNNFSAPDDCGSYVYDDLLNGIEYVSLWKAKCTMSICGGGHSYESTQRFMHFIYSVGGKPLMCKVQDDEGGPLIKFTMDKHGNINEDFDDYEPE